MNVFLDNAVANTYDEYYTTASGNKIDLEEKAIISALLNNVPAGSMLELGCGTGHWTKFFIEKGFKLTGVDVSEAMLNIAKGKNLEARFCVGNAEELLFQDKVFDLVTSITMLEFVYDVDQVIKEAFRVLKPSGYLLLGCLNKNAVLARNKKQSPTFKNARFLDRQALEKKLKPYGTPKFNSGVYLDENYEFIENLEDEVNPEPTFIGVLTQKI